MVQIKGKFIMLVSILLELYEDAYKKADQKLFNELGVHSDELKPEDWYDIKHYNNLIKAYVNASPTKEKAMLTLGKNIYPTIKRTAGLPPELKTPIDYIKFESKGYQENIKGPGIQPRKFIKEEEGNVIVQTKMLEQDCTVLVGVYLGILKIAGVSDGRVNQTKCIKNGDDICEFHITW
jgi:predicted hydrocarbon binding protein